MSFEPTRNYFYSKEGYRTVVCHETQGFGLISDYIRKFDPETIIELGTKFGGMTALFKEACPNALIYSHDNFDYRQSTKNARLEYSEKELKEFWEKVLCGVKFVKGNIIDGNCVSIVKSEIAQTKGRLFLYCDNGHKRMELSLYAPLLKAGDVVGVHDWGTEVKSGTKIVKEALTDFEHSEINKHLESLVCVDRFFVKVK